MQARNKKNLTGPVGEEYIPQVLGFVMGSSQPVTKFEVLVHMSKKRDEQDLTGIHLRQSDQLSRLIEDTIESVRAAKKLGNEKRTKLLGQLVRAHSELVKTQRTITGLDQVATSISAGVIIIPGKSADDEWRQVASKEIDNAKKLIEDASQVNHDPHPQLSKKTDGERSD